MDLDHRTHARQVFWGFVLVAVPALFGAVGCSDVKSTGGSATGDFSKGAGNQAGRAQSSSDAPKQTLARFVDVARASGATFTYRDGQEAGNYAILESLGGGAALFDYDGDGALDIFLPGGGHYGPDNEILGLPGALFRNVAARTGTFSFQEVTALAGAQLAPHYSHGAAVGDYNDDGFRDLLVTGYGGLALFHNQGDGSFVERGRSAGLDDALWSSSAAWGDLDGDGVLDLFVAHYVNWSFAIHPFCGVVERNQRYVCSPKSFQALPPPPYFAAGDGTFLDGSLEDGLDADSPTCK